MWTIYTSGFWRKHGFSTNTGFGANTVCELFPHMHTEGFCCVGQGHAIFAMNLHAVCQPNVMWIHSDIIANLHCVLCVKAFSKKCTNNRSPMSQLVCVGSLTDLPEQVKCSIFLPCSFALFIWKNSPLIIVFKGHFGKMAQRMGKTPSYSYIAEGTSWWNTP